MTENKMLSKNRKFLVLAGVLVAIVVVAYLKMSKTTTNKPKNNISAAQSVDQNSAFLFYNSKDQDSGCKAIYGLFDSLAASADVNVARIDVNDPTSDPLFDKYDIRLMPAILFVAKDGTVKKKILGEGSEVEAQIKSTFENLAGVFE